MIQKSAKISKTTWIEKSENDLSVMRLVPKKLKRETAEKETVLSVLDTIDDKCPVRVSLSNIATTIEGIYYGEVDEEISPTKDLLDFLDKNKDALIVLTDYEEVTANGKL